MMREIKFRAWFKNENEIKKVAISNVYDGNNTHLYLSPMPASDYKPIELMQYIGLKDKNGREIYEGDIVRQDYERDYNFEYDPDSLGYMGHETDYGWHKGVVSITASNGACLRNPIHYSESKEKTEVTKMYKKITGYRSEVIGNIHENPELLEEN